MADRRTNFRRIVLAGPIGAGKSTVRALLAQRGFAVVDADSIGHSVLLPDGPAFDAVAARWPDAVRNGAIDRARLAAIVFADRGQLAELEAITHPAIAREIASRVERLGDRDVVVELPLIEGIVDADWHRLVVVADDEIRLHRLLERGMDERDARARMAIQPPVAAWIDTADSMIVNNGGWDSLTEMVDDWLAATGS